MNESVSDNPFIWLLDQLKLFLLDKGDEVFLTIFFAVIIVIIKVVLDRFWSRRIRGKIPSQIANILSIFSTIFAVAVFLVLSTTIWRVESSWLLGVLGLSVGTIIGFASSDTIGNAIAGFIILFSRPFVIEDRIKIGEYMGDVEKITLIFTTLITPNLEEVNSPNRQILNSEIVNYGTTGPVRVSVSCSVDYGSNIDEFKKHLLDVILTVDGIAKVPKPFVRVINLGNYAAELSLFVFTFNPSGIPQLKADLKERIWIMYKDKGFNLTIPSLTKRVPVSILEINQIKGDKVKKATDQNLIEE
jgi:small-conductance mechanosensitive channel